MNYAEIMVRGINISNLFGYLKKRRGTLAVNELNALLEKKGLPVHSEIKDTKWYPYTLLHNVLEIMSKIIGTNFNELYYDVCYYNSKNLGFLKFFIKIAGTPKSLLETGANTWSQYYDSGFVEVNFIDKNKAEFTIKDFVKDIMFCKGFAGSLKGFLEHVVKNVEVALAECNGNKESCKYIITWS